MGVGAFGRCFGTSQTRVVLLLPREAGWVLALPSRAHRSPRERCQLTLQLSSAAIVKRTDLHTLRPFFFATWIFGKALPSSSRSGCAGWAGVPSGPRSRVRAPAVTPINGLFQAFPQKGPFLTRRLAAWQGRGCLGCPCPVSLLLSRAMESSSRPCSAGWKM